MANIQYTGEYSSDAYAYDSYDQGVAPAADPAAADASRVTLLINWAGAMVSMMLVIGMAVWAYQLLVRDVADVPVIRALDGPMRVAPENPGGAVAENQGLAVNRLAEGEEAAPVPDQLTLAPPPIDLAAADSVLTPEEQFENASAARVLPGVDDDIPGIDDVAVEVEDTDALIARLLEESVPLSDMDAPELADDPTAQDVTPGVIATSIPGPTSSPRPRTRPQDLAARALTAPAPTVAASAVIDSDDGFEIAPTELEAGTRLVQLGAFDSPELARAEWQRLSGNFPDFFLGRARVIEEAASGGQDFYRLRAHGFGDLSASRRFCAALVAQGAACIPVTVR